MHGSMDCLGVATVAYTVAIIVASTWILRNLVWRPYALTRCFHRQGIRGPTYSFLWGSLPEMKQLKQAATETVLPTDSHDITPRVLPHCHYWSSQYGETFMYWFGLQPQICISDPELVKNILSNKFGFYEKPKMQPSVVRMVGMGLVLVNGLDWVKHRRIANPAFTTDKLKVFTSRMAACAMSMLDGWEVQPISEEHQYVTKIEVSGEFEKLTADIIAHTAFGSSYIEGKEAFEAQRELQQHVLASSAEIYIPGSQYLPTPSNLRIWKADKKLKKTLRCIIKGRLNSRATTTSLGSRYGDDLLGQMIGGVSEATQRTSSSARLMELSMEEIMEECKTFFFAGHETTSSLLTWTVFLLSTHHEWQERLRQEVFKEYGMSIPDADSISKLKLMNMVLLEALRLYGPVITIVRKASEDMKLGNLMIPKDTCISIPVVKVHRDKKYWGDDANEFNPLRFINGVSKAAKHPNALIAFGLGPRTCIGQNFAMLEAKVVIALILQRFSISISPDYKHSPADHLTLHPQFGLPILVKPLCL